MTPPKRAGFVTDSIGYIPLADGSLTLVDPADLDLLTQWNWCSDGRGYVIRGHRPNRGGPVRLIKMHRFLLDLTDPEVLVDHINHDTRDNRRANLRAATRRQNTANTTPWSASGLKGVHWRADRQAWWATLKHPTRPYHLGYFATKEEAVRVWNAAARELYGEFAYQNPE